MTQQCDLLPSKSVMCGHNVSHSKRRTNRRFIPNLQSVTLRSDSLNQALKFKVATSTLRTVYHHGGLDSFLMKMSNLKLSKEAISLKKKVKAKQIQATTA